MVVSLQAIREFRSQKLRDSRKAKKFTDRALDAKLKKLGADFHTAPRWSQKISFLLGVKHKSYLFLTDMGGGKTKISLDLHKYWMDQGVSKRSLVVVPNITNIGSWGDEVEIHRPELSFMGITMSGSDERWKALTEGEEEVACITYQGLASLLCVSQKKKKGTGNRWVPDEKKIRQIGKIFKTLIVDECSLLKRHDSIYMRLVRKLSKLIPYRYALTGTPFDVNPEDLWSQFYIVDHGDTLGPTLGMFRGAFFSEKENYWGGKEYNFLQGRKKELFRRLRHSSVRFKDSECQDLPPCVGGMDGPDGFMIHKVHLPQETWAYYLKLVEELKQARKSGDRSGVQSSYYQMRCLAAGYLVTTTSKGEKIDFRFNQNPKVDAVKDWLEVVPVTEKVIVTHVYNLSGDILSESFGSKHKHVRIYGKTKDKQGALRQWMDPKGPRILLASMTICYGLNLQRTAKYMGLFESPDDGIKRKQLERRIRRGAGRKGHRYFQDFAVHKTPDFQILEKLKTGKSLMDSLLDGRMSVEDILGIEE